MGRLSIKRSVYTCCPRPLRPYWDRVEASHLGYRLARGAFWSLAGTVVSRGMMLLASIFVARMLGKEVFGQFGILQATVAMFAVFAGFGLGLTAMKYVAQHRHRAPARAGRIVALSGLVAVAFGALMAGGLFLIAGDRKST